MWPAQPYSTLLSLSLSPRLIPLRAREGLCVKRARHLSSLPSSPPPLPPLRDRRRELQPTASNLLVDLSQERAVVQIAGAECFDFVQNIITHDIRLLTRPPSPPPSPSPPPQASSLYTAMLNYQGRVLFDAFVYANTSRFPDTVFLEVDTKAVRPLLAHLEPLAFVADVDISEASQTWIPVQVLRGHGTPQESLSAAFSAKQQHAILGAHDPRRNVQLGLRLLLGSGDVAKRSPASGSLALPPDHPLNSLLAMGPQSHNAEQTPLELYTLARTKLGLVEGMSELPSGESFPLESNFDQLDGVHFNKGCYLGQELTTRTHTIGVTRKRLLPFVFASPEASARNLPADSPIVNATGKPMGKLRAVHGAYGVGLFRLELTIPNGDLYAPNSLLPSAFVQDVAGNKLEITPYVPPWWTVDGKRR